MKDEFLQQVKSATGRSKTIKVWRRATENFWTKRATEELFLILKLQVVVGFESASWDKNEENSFKM